VGAALLDGQGAAEEVRGIPHRRAEAQRLPVDDRAAPVVEEHVVEPVIAMDEPEIVLRGSRPAARWRGFDESRPSREVTLSTTASKAILPLSGSLAY
jgi:hypothetical protein